MGNQLVIDGLRYEPAPVISAGFQEKFKRAVHLSPNGVDPMLRYVWGMDRTEYVAGFEIRRYADTDNEPPKFIGRGRWVLEGWQSPDVYDRKEWDNLEHLLGPFPENGQWDFIEYHVGPEEEYLPLDGSAMIRVEEWAMWRSKGAKRSLEFLMEQKMARWALDQQARQQAAEKVLDEAGEDFVRLSEHEKNAVSTHGAGIGAFKRRGGLLVPI